MDTINKEQRNAVNRLTKYILRNIIWILGFIWKYTKILYLKPIISIPVHLISTFISLNLTRWIFDTVENQGSFSCIIILLVAVSLFRILCNLFFAVFNFLIGDQKKIELGARIREDIIRKVIRIDHIWFQNNEFFDTYTLSLNEVDNRAVAVLETVAGIVQSLCNLLLITNVTASIDLSFAYFSFALAAIEFTANLKIQDLQYLRTKSMTPADRKRGYISRITYQPEFLTDLKTHEHYPDLIFHTYRTATKNVLSVFLEYGKKLLKWDQYIQVPRELLKNLFPWIWIIYLMSRGSISIPEATVLSASAITLPANTLNLLKAYTQLYTHSLYIDNLRKIFNHPVNIEKDEGKVLSPAVALDIKVQHMNFQYEEGNEVLHDINLHIRQGDKLAIVGYNGAGKSTLVNAILRLYDTKSGTIQICGEDIKNYNIRSVRSRIAHMNQKFNIYSFTVAENILMRPVNREQDTAIVEEALRKVGLYEKVMAFPDGIHTYITREFEMEGEYFSGGELQKLALARIYAGNYDCIILDESTSALDPISEDEIITKIFEIFSDRTIIMISHRLVSVKFVDTVVFMSEGRISGMAPHEVLVQDNPEYRSFYMAQADKFIMDPA